MTVVRDLFPGMGRAVAERTVLRNKTMVKVGVDDLPISTKLGKPYKNFKIVKTDDTHHHVLFEHEFETWSDVAERVAKGNSLLHPTGFADQVAYEKALKAMALLMSGRHLQHGDADQKSRPLEVMTNCSTAAFTSLLFYLLLNGSGVGRCYDDDMMIVDWGKMPIVVPVIDWGHKDVVGGRLTGYMTEREARHLYEGSEIVSFRVPDTREGWAKAVEKMEWYSYLEASDLVLLLDFSDVRPHGSPIMGMQGRPASGPGPLMGAISNITRLRGTSMERWRQAMYIDHYLAEVVLVGGARRAARIAVKHWKEPGIFGFINVKRPPEFFGKSISELQAMKVKPFSFLWSSNNSVAVDAEFWNALDEGDHEANLVFHAVIGAQYGDGTGEPGFINVDLLETNTDGMQKYKHALVTDFFEDAHWAMVKEMSDKASKKDKYFITNPCGEIVLSPFGGFCVIGDVAPVFAETTEEAREAFRQATKALIRTNLMPSTYQREVERTNRIGVSLTGLHEYAWKVFGLSFRDLIEANEEGEEVLGPNGDWLPAPSAKAFPFWKQMAEFAKVVEDTATSYSKEIGVVVPHTMRTVKPAGTTSKLAGLTEGVHLPASREYLRWVQFRHDDPLVEEYKTRGYPTRVLKSYEGTIIVGFPTQPLICQIMPSDQVVTAGEATPEEQFRWLQLLECFWIGGDVGNQISYTLKYNPDVVGFDAYCALMKQQVRTVRAVSVLPQIDELAYEYQPEEPLTKHRYEEIMRSIREDMNEDIGVEHLQCGTGGCPIDFSDVK